MFHAPMRKFQLEFIYYFTYFSTVVPSKTCVFLSCRPFVVNTTFSTELVGVQVSSTPARPVEKCCINNERPTGNKHTSVGWDDGEK